jgi:hypothetical protein
MQMRIRNKCNYLRGIAGEELSPGETAEVDPSEEIEDVIRRSNHFEVIEEQQNQVTEIEEEDDE